MEPGGSAADAEDGPHRARGARSRRRFRSGARRKSGRNGGAGAGEGAVQIAVQIVFGRRVGRGKSGLPCGRMIFTAAAGRPDNSSSVAIQRSAILQSGGGKRCGMRRRCRQL